jgi:hypothetical protein
VKRLDKKIFERALEARKELLGARPARGLKTHLGQRFHLWLPSLRAFSALFFDTYLGPC